MLKYVIMCLIGVSAFVYVKQRKAGSSKTSVLDDHINIIEDQEEEEEISYLDQLKAEEDAAEACYGNCMNCCHFCKDKDPDIVFGDCKLYNSIMLQDDGCYDYEDRY